MKIFNTVKKYTCPNEVNLKSLKALILDSFPTAEVYLLPNSVVQICTDSDEDFSDVVESHDGAAQNLIDAEILAWDTAVEKNKELCENIIVEHNGNQYKASEKYQTRINNLLPTIEGDEPQVWVTSEGVAVFLLKSDLLDILKKAKQKEHEIWAEFIPST